MRVWMVSGLRLAHCRDIVSCTPKKMHSTATAKPLNTSEEYLKANDKNTPGMESMSHAKQDRFGN
jgi:hypothetical protein